MVKNHTVMNCNHQNHKKIYISRITSVYSCRVCGLIFTDKYRKNFDAEDLYMAYYKNEMAASRFGVWIEYFVRLFRFFRAIKIYSIYPGAKNILDIGSGRGFLLFYLKKYFKYQRTAGTQISKNAYLFSKNKLGLEIYNRDLLELSIEHTAFDVISMWHVLEHVPDPEKYIEKIHALLKRNGKAAIEVPNFNSWSRRLTRQYWLGLDFAHHVTFFTPYSLSLLLKKNNFKINIVHTFSLEYSAFISAQSFVSLLTRSDHLFFRYLQVSRFSWRILPHLLLFVVLFPVCFLINVLLFYSKRGEVLLIVAEKK